MVNSKNINQIYSFTLVRDSSGRGNCQLGASHRYWSTR